MKQDRNLDNQVEIDMDIDMTSNSYKQSYDNPDSSARDNKVQKQSKSFTKEIN